MAGARTNRMSIMESNRAVCVNEVITLREHLYEQYLHKLATSKVSIPKPEPNMLSIAITSTPFSYREATPLIPRSSSSPRASRSPRYSTSLTPLQARRLSSSGCLPPTRACSQLVSSPHSPAYSSSDVHAPRVYKSSPPQTPDIASLMAKMKVTSPLDSPPEEKPAIDANITFRRRGKSSIMPSKPGIRKFYHPRGKSHLYPSEKLSIEALIMSRFDGMPNGRADNSQMLALAKIVRLPGYTKAALMASCVGGLDGVSHVTRTQFLDWWRRHSAKDGDEASRFIDVLTHGQRDYLIPSDFGPILHDIIHTFPGLEFLKESPLFHGRYIQTVTMRIFYSVCRSSTDTITADELRKSNLIKTFHLFDRAGESPPMSPYLPQSPVDEYTQPMPCIDINSLTDYFAYEHFYVIYCKFWEIDTDHDLLVNANDLECYVSGGHPSMPSFSPLIVDRLLSAACRRRSAYLANPDSLTYNEFVTLILADEDKTEIPSIEFWFRVLDQDGDGILSYYELSTFYDAICGVLRSLNTEPMAFPDVLCQMLDVIDYRPCADLAYNETSRLHDVETKSVGVRLSHLKRSRHMAPHFLNTFVNCNKYMDQELNESQNDRKDCEDEFGTRLRLWDRFCRQEYDALMREDENYDDSYDVHHELNMDDCTSDED